MRLIASSEFATGGSEGGGGSSASSAGGCRGVTDFPGLFAEAQEVLRKDPYRVGLPGAALGRRFVETPTPFEKEFWVLESGGKLLGRIGANLSPSAGGAIGFFDAADFGAARELVGAAVEWLRRRGVRRAYGPMNFNTWLPYRFRVQRGSASALSAGASSATERAEDPVFSWEPVNPPEYPLWFAELGFSVAAEYHTDGLDGLEGILEGTRRDYEKCLSLGYTVRPVDAETLLEKEVPRLYEISMASFTRNFLFEAVPYEFFHQLYVPLAKKADLSLARFVCDPSGKEVAYFFNFSDSGYFVSKTVGVLPECRGMGLSNAALHSAVATGLSQGLQRSIMALMKTGIQSESYGKKQNQLWRHEYILMQKEMN